MLLKIFVNIFIFEFFDVHSNELGEHLLCILLLYAHVGLGVEVINKSVEEPNDIFQEIWSDGFVGFVGQQSDEHIGKVPTVEELILVVVLTELYVKPLRVVEHSLDGLFIGYEPPVGAQSRKELQLAVAYSACGL